MIDLIINSVWLAMGINAVQYLLNTSFKDKKMNETILKETFITVLKNIVKSNEANSLFIKIASILLNKYSLNSLELNDLKNVFEIKYNIKIPETIRTQKELKSFLIIIGNKQH